MKHVGPISGIAVSGNGYIATAGYDNKVILWNSGDGMPVARVWHDHLANQCAFSADGRYLVTASSDYSARVWAVPRMTLISVLVGHEDDVEMASFSPNGERIATCSRDGKVRIFAREGTLQLLCVGHDADVISVSWTSDGQRLVSSSDDGTIRHWDASNGECLQVEDFGGIETDTLIITAGGQVLAGNDNGQIISLGGDSPRVWQAHGAGVKRLAYSDAQSLLVSLSYDRSMALWKLGVEGDLQLIDRAELPAIVWPRSCGFDGDSRIVFGTFGSKYASYDFHSKTWNIDGIERDKSINAVAIHDGAVYTVGDSGVVHRDQVPFWDAGSLCNFLTPYNGGLLTGGQVGQLFDVERGIAFHTHSSPINCCTVIEIDGSQMAVFGTYDGTGLVFSLSSERPPNFIASVKMHSNAIKGLAARDGRLFSVCATGSTALHEVDGFTPIPGYKGAHDKISNGCATTPDGFASIGRDLKLRLWSENGQTGCVDAPHNNSVKCIALSNNGKYLATGSYGGSVAIYSLDESEWVVIEHPSSSGISSIAACGDGFIASSYDGEVHSLRVQSRQLVS
jgi:WD40 repeat protein